MTANVSFDRSGWSQKSIRTYAVGFAICLVLTMLSFGLIQVNFTNKALVYGLLALSAIAQLLVQVVCFLGLKSDRAGQWNLLPFLFTLLIIFFLVGGSLWIMNNLNMLMMNVTMAS